MNQDSVALDACFVHCAATNYAQEIYKMANPTTCYTFHHTTQYELQPSLVTSFFMCLVNVHLLLINVTSRGYQARDV